MPLYPGNEGAFGLKGTPGGFKCRLLGIGYRPQKKPGNTSLSPGLYHCTKNKTGFFTKITIPPFS